MLFLFTLTCFKIGFFYKRSLLSFYCLFILILHRRSLLSFYRLFIDSFLFTLLCFKIGFFYIRSLLSSYRLLILVFFMNDLRYNSTLFFFLLLWWTMFVHFAVFLNYFFYKWSLFSLYLAICLGKIFICQSWIVRTGQLGRLCQPKMSLFVGSWDLQAK